MAQVVHCIQPRQAVEEDAASLSKIKTLIVHHSSRNGNEAKQPYHVITNPVIRTEGDSVIPDMTCKQGPHVRTRPQASETIRKNRSHHHQPNFRETHSGQKSGVLHQLIPWETRVLQNLQTPFGGVDVARNWLSKRNQLAGQLTCFTREAGAFAPLIGYTWSTTMSGPLGRPRGGLSTWPSLYQISDIIYIHIYIYIFLI